MKVKTLIKFIDLKADCMREIGEEFECTQERYDEIIAAHPEPLVKRVNNRGKKNAKPADDAE